MIRCEEHPDADIIQEYNSNEKFCKECGVVLERVLDYSADLNKVGDDDDGLSNVDPYHVGSAQISSLNENLSTIFGPSPSGYLDATKDLKMKSGKSYDRTLKTGFAIISNMAERLHAQNIVIDNAKTKFKQILDTNKMIMKGMSQDTVAAVSLYIAFRQSEIPRSFHEISKATNTSLITIKKGHTKIFKIIDMDYRPVVGIHEYIPRFCGNLKLPKEITNAALHISTKIKQFPQLLHRMPVTNAATAIYMAVKEAEHQLDIKKLSEASGVGVTTINYAYKEMRVFSKQLLPKKI